MGKLRTLWTLVLLVGCGGLAYKGWQNSRIPHAVDAQAESIACDQLQACTGGAARWTALDASPFARIYTLDAGSETVTIECRWSMVLLGEVTCRANREEIAAPAEKRTGPRPHELGRGNLQ